MVRNIHDMSLVFSLDFLISKKYSTCSDTAKTIIAQSGIHLEEQNLSKPKIVYYYKKSNIHDPYTVSIKFCQHDFFYLKNI